MHTKLLSVASALMAVGVGSASTTHAATIFAIDDNPGQHLITFDSAAPTALTSSYAITGLQANEKLIGIDFRVNSVTPANNNVLYGVGSFGRVYTLNQSTGAASFVSQVSVLLNGTEFGFDFNPQADRLRIVSDLDQNLRINVDTGATIIDTPLNPGNPNITNVAYDRPDSSAGTPTTLYGIDTFSNQLVLIGGVDGAPSPNGGTITPIGSLIGIDPTGIGGFDIEPGTGLAFLASRNAAGGGSMLSTVNLNTGQAVLVGFIGNPEDGLVIKGIAMADPIPEPTAVSALALAGLAALSRRRRRN